MKLKLNKLMLNLIFFICLFSQVYSYVAGASYVKIEGADAYQQLGITNKYTTGLNILTLICTIYLAILEWSRFKKISSKFYRFICILVCCACVVWTGLSLIYEGFIGTFYSSTPPFLYLVVLCVVIGANDNLFETFLKNIAIYGYLSLILSVYYYIDFAKTYNALLANSASLVFLVQAFWLLLSYSLLSKKKNSLFIYISIFICGVLAVLFNSRSYIIQTLLWLIIYVFYSSKSKFILSFFKIVVFIAIIFTASYFIVNKYMPERIESLIEKLMRDTRSHQYDELFSQVSIFDFILGRGHWFTYINKGEEYAYIDNGFILTFIRYGIIIGLGYPLLLIIPAIKNIFSKKTLNALSFIVIFWIMALAGLSIFTVLGIDLKTIVIMVIAGRCLYLVERRVS